MQHVLVIDDEIDVRDSIKRVLERAGYQVSTAESAPEGLAAMQARAPDVVITDIIMPRMNGVEAITAIRERFPAVRIVAISGGGNVGLMEYKPEAITTTAFLAAAEKSGAHLVLTKPFESKDLLQAVRAVSAAGQA